MTALPLRPGVSASVALLAPAQSPAQSPASGTCRAASSATIYPSALALGAGATVSFGRPVSVCGQVRTLSYQAGRRARARCRSLAEPWRRRAPRA